ncbi:UDP-N-acetylglucosamine transferase subunit ALG14 [Escovopsis weberi]|uniref:UDP-N-acetylglucosamine transferase subunit ALG14 n=1 Tax=Escovopsis weberi TaxID=150374 RepID=A0A0M8MWA7_ESCWE|nr:UDP-N-acetylglucosamine transferase subunit ALG14 [Escovopsis weberi]
MTSLLTLISRSLRRAILPGLIFLITFLIFVTTRHLQLISSRCPNRRPKLLSRTRNGDAGGDHAGGSRAAPPDFYLFVLGSGGHTKEMLMMMDDGFCDVANVHRRYLVSSGDAVSRHQVADYEHSLALLCAQHGSDSSRGRDKDKNTHTEGDADAEGDSLGSSGSHDVVTVSRARRIHQPLWSTPLTALASILDILPALLTPPPNYRRGGRSPRFPSIVFSNGPGTGFAVALAVHLIKMFYVVPEGCMKFVYIESWARISTLSLTGRLLYHMGLADVFVTQHQEVADRYGLFNAGEMVFNSRREDPPR